MLKRIAWAAALALALGTTASAQTAARTSAQTAWPNQQGNSWTFRQASGAGSGSTTWTNSRRSGGWVYVDGFSGGAWFWMSGSSGNIWTYNFSNQTFSRFLNLGAGQGQTFLTEPTDLSCWSNVRWVVSDTRYTAQTPAGTFQNCTVIEGSGGACRDAGMMRMVFAPNVGPVSYTEQSIAGPRRYDLSSATVNGTTYPVRPTFQAAHTVSVSIDRWIYPLTINRMPTTSPTVRPPQPSTLQAQLEIANQTTSAKEIVYSSGMTNDWIIRDAQGNEVYQWSAGKFFTQALRRVTIPAGGKISLQISIELRDDQGNALPAGRYSLEAVHAEVNPRPRLIVPFEIKEQIVY